QLRQRLGRGRRIGVRNIEQEAIGENSVGSRHGDDSGSQLFLIQLEPPQPPRPERQRIQVKLQRVFQEPVLELEVLGREKSALGPNDGLQSLHMHSTYQDGPGKQSGLAFLTVSASRGTIKSTKGGPR